MLLPGKTHKPHPTGQAGGVVSPTRPQLAKPPGALDGTNLEEALVDLQRRYSVAASHELDLRFVTA